MSPLELKGKSLLKEELKAFGVSLREYGDQHMRRPADWTEAFLWLKDLLKQKPEDEGRTSSRRQDCLTGKK